VQYVLLVMSVIAILSQMRRLPYRSTPSTACDLLILSFCQFKPPTEYKSERIRK
jgi:hypothetical protein